MPAGGTSGPILDVRLAEAFAAGHAPGAVNIPAKELAARAHELPPKGAAIDLFDDDPDTLRIAAHALRRRGYVVREVGLPASELCESGPSRAHLWQPSPFLVEALECIRARRGGAPSPVRAPREPLGLVARSPWATVREVSDVSPRLGKPALPQPSLQVAAYAKHAPFPGRALDLACGSGRDAVYLALAGYAVEAIDVLPDALERARDLARRSGVHIETIQQDLRRSPVLPAERYDLVAVVRFLHRPLLPAMRRAVAPGGFVVYEAFHRRDAEEGRRSLKPGRAVEDGELAAAFDGFEMLIVHDGIERGGRVFSQLLARRRL